MTEGIICAISAIEPCRSFQVSRYPETGRLQIRSRDRKCLHHHLYLTDPEFGFMHVCIQGRMPWEIRIYLNGREWLARQLDAAGVTYLRHDNALLRIDDLETAGRLCERFVHKARPRVLDALCRPRTKNGRTHARFSPLTKGDLTLFRAALAGEHAIGGFRNRDLMRHPSPSAPIDPEDAQRRCQRVSRLIVKPRGHGLVAKIPHARRYRVTAYGHRVMSAALYVHDHGFAVRFLDAA